MDNRTKKQLLQILMIICIVTLMAITVGAVISQFLPDSTPGETPGDTPGDTHICVPGVSVKENEIKATCKMSGRYDEVIYCVECGEEMSRISKTSPKLKTHTKASPVKENEIKATCSAGGSYDLVVYCSVCKIEISRTAETTEIDPNAHTPETVIENVVEATCSDGGSYDEVSYCSGCSIELGRTTVETEKNGIHTPAEAVVENEIAATCKNTGSYDLVIYCSVCGEELGRTAKTSPVEKHRFGRDGICAICGDKASADLQYVSNGDGTCYIAGIGACTDTEIVIPKRSPSGDLIIAIAESAFEDCDKIVSIAIPEDVTSIGGYAFKGCTGLTQIRLAGNCRIDPAAFEQDQVIYVFAPANGLTQTFCNGDNNRIFVPEATQE